MAAGLQGGKRLTPKTAATIAMIAASISGKTPRSPRT
jgi:hypothetical protein